MSSPGHLIQIAQNTALALAVASFSLFGLYFLWLFTTQIMALFLQRGEDGSGNDGMAPTTRFAVLVCACNEECVIARLVESLRTQEYDRELFDVFVVAHNCTDATAQAARESGAHVFICNAPGERRKAYALTHGIREIRRLPVSYDAFAFFDADNVADPFFLTCADRALVRGADVVQGKYSSYNYHENAISELSGALWLQTFHTQSITFTRMGLPVLVYGTGFVLRASALGPDGWPTATLVEDFEMSIMLALADRNMVGNGGMRTYAEQPLRFRDALEQRRRWAVGDMQCLRRYFFPILRAIPQKGIHAVKILIDLLLSVALIGFAAGVIFLVAFVALSGLSLTVFLSIAAALVGAYWLLVDVQSLIMFRKEGMRIRDNMATLALFPFWIILSSPLACYALFVKNVEWKRAPRRGKGAGIKSES